MKKIYVLLSFLLFLSLLSSCIVHQPEDKQTLFTIEYTVEIYHQSFDDRYELIESKIEENIIGTFVILNTNYLGFTLNKEISNYIFVVTDDMESIQIYYDRNRYDIAFYTSNGLFRTVQLKFGEVIHFPTIDQVLGWKDVAGNEITTEIVASQNENFYAIEAEGQLIVFEGYYAILNDVTIDMWYETLQMLIRSYTFVPYANARYILQDSDEDPNNQDNILLIYNRASVLSTWDAGVTWNREHVWPRSKLFNTTAEADLHLLRPSNPTLNNRRGNLPFVDGEGEARIIGSGFYPGDEDRGDIARIVFYVLMMWETNIDLIGDLHTFLKWHEEDPVDDFERQRNQVIYAYQRNRNPFIDYPELVSIFYPQQQTQIQFYTFTVDNISYREKNAHKVHFFINSA